MKATRVPDAPLPFGSLGEQSIAARGRWPVQWLEFPSTTPGVAGFRLAFELQEPAVIRLRLSAGERYRIFLDGEEAGTGPERGDLHHWRLDTWDLEAGPGRHWLAVEVWALGEKAPKWQEPVPPGLVVIADEPHFHAISTGHAAWESATLDAVTFTDQPMACLTGPRAVIDGPRYPWDWAIGRAGSFEKARPSRRGVCGGPEGWEVDLPRLVPARLPVPTHGVIPNGTAVFVEDGLPAPDGHHPANPDANLPGEIPSWQAWLDGGCPLALPPGSSRRALIFLGTYRAAWPVLRASGAGGLVRIRFAEALFLGTPPDGAMPEKGDRREWINKIFRGTGPDFLTTSDAHDFRACEWECGQWVEVSVSAGESDPLTLDGLRLHDASFPLVDEGAMESDSSALNTLRDLCVRTLRVGTHGHYCDCPAYERLQYLGDTRLEILSTYCLTSDNRLPARALDDFARSRFADGLLPSRFPASGRQSIPPFSLWWIGMLHDSVFWRGNERLAGYLPVARGILDAWWNARSADGLAGGLPGWNFVDWAEGWESGMPPGADRGPSSVLNWQFVWALRQAAELETLAGEPELAALHRRRSDEIAAAIDAACWDDARGCYLDAPESTAASEHAQILALLAGVDQTRQTRVAEALATSNDLTRTTIYFSHYLFEAWRQLGRGDLIWQRLGLWFDLASRGLVTTPEQPEPTRSDCHPWGIHPLYHTVASFAGLRPTAPAFAAAELNPLPNIPLRKLHLTVPHPRGVIQIRLHRPSTEAPWAGSLAIPEGITASVPDGIGVFPTMPGGDANIS